MKTYFITTAIPYINAPAHIGHAQEFFIADTLSRTLKAQGYQVLLQSGTDDNSLKNVLSAREKNIPLKEYLDTQGENFKVLLDQLNIHPNYFVNTSSNYHHKVVKEFLNNLNPKDLYIKDYEGKYCIGCEDFIKDSELNQGLCPDHKKEPELIKESNVFFKLSDYQDKIYELIESDLIKITPAFRKKEILSFIKSGLQDISISRPQKHSGFGIDFPNHPNQIVYVWIDALINYISGIHENNPRNWQNHWNSYYKVHVIGKNVWKFHAIYWVGLLLSAKLNPPNEIFIHGFLTNEGVKISKSLGNAINPLSLLEKFDADTLRAFLVGKLNFEKDSDFNQKDLSKFYLDELLNQVGNLFPRITTLAKKESIDYELKNILPTKDIKDLWENIFTRSCQLNKEINDSFIWKKPSGAEKTETIKKWLLSLEEIAQDLKILCPEKKELIDKALKGEKVLIFKKPK